jgi:disulfide bond formation protein DsbB
MSEAWAVIDPTTGEWVAEFSSRRSAVRTARESAGWCVRVEPRPEPPTPPYGEDADGGPLVAASLVGLAMTTAPWSATAFVTSVFVGALMMFRRPRPDRVAELPGARVLSEEERYRNNIRRMRGQR